VAEAGVAGAGVDAAGAGVAAAAAGVGAGAGVPVGAGVPTAGVAAAGRDADAAGAGAAAAGGSVRVGMAVPLRCGAAGEGCGWAGDAGAVGAALDPPVGTASDTTVPSGRIATVRTRRGSPRVAERAFWTGPGPCGAATGSGFVETARTAWRTSTGCSSRFTTRVWVSAAARS
jgi:hypothetical protein